MAAHGILALLDDIATILDDVAILTKVAAKKTAGVLGDDLALNAEQVTGVKANRELPVVWAVAKGSALNKVILVPIALIISATIPWLITPLLMIGGGFLCFEGVEKVLHKFLHTKEEDHEKHKAMVHAIVDNNADMKEFEKTKIKGAIKTDFILSAEIIVIALGTVKDETIFMQAAVVTAISSLMTIGVYILVAIIVKLDDMGMHMNKQEGFKQKLGKMILIFAPILMKGLSIIGTAAMFLVGGGILVHGIPGAEDFIHHLDVPSIISPIIGPLFSAIIGIIAGAIILGLVKAGQKAFSKK